MNKQKQAPNSEAAVKTASPAPAPASPLMRRLTRRAGLRADPGRVNRMVSDVLAEPGQPLESEAREFMEARLGHDFSRVRVHAGGRASESARALQARAYTFGRDIVFASGEYRPQDRTGRRLIAHELAHVVQQDGKPRPNAGHAPLVDPSQASESAAGVAGRIVESRQPVIIPRSAFQGQAIQRQAASFDAIPSSSLQGIMVSTLAADVPADRIRAYFRLLPNSTNPGEREYAPGQVTFQTGIAQNLRLGLESVGGYLANVTNTLPQNSTINVALNLSSYGGANTIYRFTRYTVTSGRTATDHFLIEEVGAAPAAPAAVTAAAGSFTVNGQNFTLTSGWSDANYALLRQALGMMPAAALAEAAGLSFQYRSGSGSGGEAGEYDRANDRVILFSNAFPTASVRFGTSVTGVRNILHEIGHALDLRPLEQAARTFDTAGQTTAARRTFLASRSLSGSRYVDNSGRYESDVNISAARDGAFRRAARSDGVRRDTSGRMIDLGGGVQIAAGISGGVTRYSDVNYEELFAESYAIYMTDPDRLRLMRPNVYQYFVGRYPRTP